MIRRQTKPASNRIRKQRGIALVSVLGAIAVITAIISALAYRQQVDVGIQSYAIQKNAAILDVLSVENIASKMLTANEPNKDSNAYDYYTESWAEPVEDLELGGSKISFMVLDAQAKFNLNNLNVRGSTSVHSRQVLSRIFAALNLETPQMVPEIVSWVSPYGNIRQKDTKYMAENDKFSKYRVSNSPLASVQELRLISAIRDKEDLSEIVAGFDDYVVTLPTVSEFIKINVNTANGDLLDAVLKYFQSPEAMLTVATARPYSNVNGFCALMKQRRNICPTIFDVKSSYFYVVALINKGNNIFYSRSLLRVAGRKTTVITREIKAA